MILHATHMSQTLRNIIPKICSFVIGAIKLYLGMTIF